MVSMPVRTAPSTSWSIPATRIRAQGGDAGISGDGCRGPATRASRHIAKITPRVIRRPKGGVFRRGPHGKFVHVGLANTHCPSRFKTLHHCSIVWWHKIGQETRGTSGPYAFGADIVLDGQRDPF